MKLITDYKTMQWKVLKNKHGLANECFKKAFVLNKSCSTVTSSVLFLFGFSDFDFKQAMVPAPWATSFLIFVFIFFCVCLLF